jgi:hypothetical protein
MRIRLLFFILFLPAIWSLFLESASGQTAPPIFQVSSLPTSCTNGALYQVNGHKSLFCTNGILLPLDSGATPIDPLDYGVQANWKEFWASCGVYLIKLAKAPVCPPAGELSVNLRLVCVGSTLEAATVMRCSESVSI